MRRNENQHSGRGGSGLLDSGQGQQTPRFHRGRGDSRLRPSRRGTVDKTAGIQEGLVPQEVHARDTTLRRLLAMADAIALGVALTVAFPLLGGPPLEPLVLALVPLTLLLGSLSGLYAQDEIVISKETLRDGPRLAQVASLLTLVLYVGQNYFAEWPLAARQGIAMFGAFVLAAMITRALVRRMHVKTIGPERCLVIGPRDRAARVEEKLTHDPASKTEVVKTIDPAELPAGEAGRDVLAGAVRRCHVHRVIVASAAVDDEDVLEIVRDMKGLGVKVSLKPPLMGVVGSAVVFDDVHGDVFLGVRRFGLTASEQRTKRAMDIAGALVGLIAMAPLLAVIALAIKLDSRGPVFFRQRRIGRDGDVFSIVKFRTMDPDAEARKDDLRDEGAAEGGLFKLESDPRVTRVGRFLRGTSLDELPQLINVLRGEMSLVGPRPLVLDEDAQIVGWHRRRLHLTPGVTGVWQVLGSNRVPLRDMVALDYLYIVNWSVWRDVEITLRTIGFMLGRRGM